MTPATKAELQALEARIVRAIKTSAEEVKLYFDVKVEQLTHDYRGIFNDRTVDLKTARDDHEHRIGRLERRVGSFS